MKNKKQVRKNFRNSVLSRDKCACKMCGKKGKDRQGGDLWKEFHKSPLNLVDLDAHHIIERNNDNYILDNGITVCDDCHLKAEKFHITNGKEWVNGFHPNELFEKINSKIRIQ